MIHIVEKVCLRTPKSISLHVVIIIVMFSVFFFFQIFFGTTNILEYAVFCYSNALLQFKNRFGVEPSEQPQKINKIKLYHSYGTHKDRLYSYKLFERNHETISALTAEVV